MRKKKPNIKKSEYQNLYDCIRTDQVPEATIAWYFEDKPFLNWFRKKFNKKWRKIYDRKRI
jgi:hypothetical protein